MKVVKGSMLLALLALAGCASVISKELRAQAVPIRGLSEVRENPDVFKGKTVVLGGTIIETRNTPEGTTLLVLDRPLGNRDEPTLGEGSDGRFMAEVPRYLDPVLFALGSAVTVAGAVTGVRSEPVGQAPYTYVVIQAQEVHLWSRDRYPPYPYYYDPFWYDPFWGPGPWRWGPGFENHQFHH